MIQSALVHNAAIIFYYIMRSTPHFF